MEGSGDDKMVGLTPGSEGSGINDPMAARTTDTGNMKRMAVEQQAKRTIKLKPLTPKAPSQAAAPAPAPAAAANSEETISMDSSDLEEPTVKVPKIQVAATTPSLPGLKQTIKLRPSSAGAEAPASSPAADVKAGSATIKLKPSTITPAAAPEAAAPAAKAADLAEEKTSAIGKQTIRLVPRKPESSAAPAPSDPTIKLGGSVAPSEPTVKFEATQELPAEEAAPAAAAEPRIGIKKHVQTETAQDLAYPEPDYLKTEVKPKSEPSIIFTIAASISVLVLAWSVFSLFTHYNSIWN